jgi:prepilin signal peptidase PulO-like enzyme (type II secretory pathway)
MWAADIADRSLVHSTLALTGFYAALALSAVDLRDYRLPDVLTLPLAAAGVLASWWLGFASPWWAIGSALPR